MGVNPALSNRSRCSIIGLNINHKKNDIPRAVLEGIIFESKLVTDILEKTGVRIKEVRATEGCAKSIKWLQLKANILNKKIVILKVKDCGLMGAIIIASTGINRYGSIEEAISDSVEIENVFLPEIYKNIYPALLPIYEDTYYQDHGEYN